MVFVSQFVCTTKFYQCLGAGDVYDENAMALIYASLKSNFLLDCAHECGKKYISPAPEMITNERAYGASRKIVQAGGGYKVKAYRTLFIVIRYMYD